MEEKKTVVAEVDTLLVKMRGIRAGGGTSIACVEVCEHLVRILMAVQNEKETMIQEISPHLKSLI